MKSIKKILGMLFKLFMRLIGYRKAHDILDLNMPIEAIPARLRTVKDVSRNKAVVKKATNDAANLVNKEAERAFDSDWFSPNAFHWERAFHEVGFNAEKQSTP